MPSATAVAETTVSPASSYAVSGPIDPARFYPKFGPLPAVVGVRDQTGPWDVAGQRRTLELSDGGHVVETITDTEAPGYFAYDLSEFQKLFGHLVSGARAEWRYVPSSSGTRVSWTYTFHALPGRGWIVAAIVRVFWAPYMRRVLPAIAREISHVG